MTTVGEFVPSLSCQRLTCRGSPQSLALRFHQGTFARIPFRLSRLKGILCVLAKRRVHIFVRYSEAPCYLIYARHSTGDA
jgi:hypothetical protein